MCVGGAERQQGRLRQEKKKKRGERRRQGQQQQPRDGYGDGDGDGAHACDDISKSQGVRSSEAEAMAMIL